jgi:hypothetical protein
MRDFDDLSDRLHEAVINVETAMVTETPGDPDMTVLIRQLEKARRLVDGGMFNNPAPNRKEIIRAVGAAVRICLAIAEKAGAPHE